MDLISSTNSFQHTRNQSTPVVSSAEGRKQLDRPFADLFVVKQIPLGGSHTGEMAKRPEISKVMLQYFPITQKLRTFAGFVLDEERNMYR